VHVVAQKLEAITNFQLKARRVLKGHQGKVLAIDWSSDKRHIASTSQVKIKKSKYQKFKPINLYINP